MPLSATSDSGGIRARRPPEGSCIDHGGQPPAWDAGRQAGRRASCGRGRFLPPGAPGIAGRATRTAGRAPDPARGSPPDPCTEMPGRPAAAPAAARRRPPPPARPGAEQRDILARCGLAPARRSRQGSPACTDAARNSAPCRSAGRARMRARAHRTPLRSPPQRPNPGPSPPARLSASRTVPACYSPPPLAPDPSAPPRPAVAAGACAPKGKIGSPGAAARAEAHL